jgi:hypothetical protein
MQSQPYSAPKPAPCEEMKSVQCAEASSEGLTKATIMDCVPILHKIPAQTSLRSVTLILTLLLEVTNIQSFQSKQT